MAAWRLAAPMAAAPTTNDVFMPLCLANVDFMFFCLLFGMSVLAKCA
jgi:hypothetical protein